MILRQLRSSERTPSAPSHLKRYHSFTMDLISLLNTFFNRVLVCPNVSMPTNISNALQRVVKVFVKYLSMLQEQLLWSIERRSPSFALFCRQLVSFHIFLHSPFVPLFNSSGFFYHLSYFLYISCPPITPGMCFLFSVIIFCMINRKSLLLDTLFIHCCFLFNVGGTRCIVVLGESFDSVLVTVYDINKTR